MSGAGYIVVIIIGLALAAIVMQMLSDHNRESDFINKNIGGRK